MLATSYYSQNYSRIIIASLLWMLPKCIVFNGVAVFKTPACAKKDRLAKSIILK